MNASTSARVGRPAEPPKRVHFNPATAAAKRSAAASPRPSASARAKPPCNASPAPSVSTARIANTGTRRSKLSSRKRMSFGPLLTARKESVYRATPQSFGQVGAAGRSDEALRGKDHVGGDAQQRIVHHRALVGIEHDAQAAP